MSFTLNIIPTTLTADSKSTFVGATLPPTTLTVDSKLTLVSTTLLPDVKSITLNIKPVLVEGFVSYDGIDYETYKAKGNAYGLFNIVDKLANNNDIKETIIARCALPIKFGKVKYLPGLYIKAMYQPGINIPPNPIICYQFGKITDNTKFDAFLTLIANRANTSADYNNNKKKSRDKGQKDNYHITGPQLLNMKKKLYLHGKIRNIMRTIYNTINNGVTNISKDNPLVIINNGRADIYKTNRFITELRNIVQLEIKGCCVNGKSTNSLVKRGPGYYYNRRHNPYLLTNLDTDQCKIIYDNLINLGEIKEHTKAEQVENEKYRKIYDTLISEIGDNTCITERVCSNNNNFKSLLGSEFDIERKYKDLPKIWIDDPANSKTYGDLITYKNNSFYTHAKYLEEKTLVDYLKETLSDNVVSYDEKIDIKHMDKSLHQEQKDAVTMALKHKICLITGGGGTGKSHVIKAICQLLNIRCDTNSSGSLYKLTSFTNRSVANLRKLSLEVLTTHMLTKCLDVFSLISGTHSYRLPNNRDITANQYQDDDGKIRIIKFEKEIQYIIIDEVSMVSISRIAAIINFMEKYQTMPIKFILVGDIKQLLPVRAAGFMNYLLQLKDFPITVLKYNHRSSAYKSWNDNISNLVDHIERPLGRDFTLVTSPSVIIDYNTDYNDDSSIAKSCVGKIFMSIYNDTSSKGDFAKQKSEVLSFKALASMNRTRDLINSFCQRLRFGSYDAKDNKYIGVNSNRRKNKPGEGKLPFYLHVGDIVIVNANEKRSKDADDTNRNRRFLLKGDEGRVNSIDPK